MDQTIVDKLNEIRNKDMSALTESDKVFLRARVSYLGKRTQAKYAEVLSAKPVVTKTPRVKKVVNPLDHPANL